MSLYLDKSRFYLARLYTTEAVSRDEYLDYCDVGEKNRFYKTIEKLAYKDALVLEVGNGKFIDLAEIKGAVDYFALATCARFNIKNKKLASWEYVEKLKPGETYVKFLKPAFGVEGARIKNGVLSSGKICLKSVIKEAENIRSQAIKELEQ